ncbi:hypothetical protein BJ138DRAFT_499000 [Hygrophoropsis aurantiaca]|uniref:Uncharacterized protein n=1 Tax=Hygrophoropsis aurantiaca TaxID=72124 RepID=A0ACB8A3W4_9AGAM|nr:hypothetical protein BJ138DRAFT_499000 [Hygrophoropsis aurantiaca]
MTFLLLYQAMHFLNPATPVRSWPGKAFKPIQPAAHASLKFFDAIGRIIKPTYLDRTVGEHDFWLRYDPFSFTTEYDARLNIHFAFLDLVFVGSKYLRKPS